MDDVTVMSVAMYKGSVWISSFNYSREKVKGCWRLHN